MRDTSQAREGNSLPMILFGLAMALLAGLATALAGFGLLAAIAAYAVAGSASVALLGTVRAIHPRRWLVSRGRRLTTALSH
jgi:hypothetical protein